MNTSIETISGIYIGDRGPRFKTLITTLLQKSGIKKKYITTLTDEKSMDMYSAAFTSELVDEDHNYQVYEQKGDLTGNKFIVNYFYERFPQLDCTDGVKVIARLRINYGAKQSFSDIAKRLGFWEFISATNDLRQRKMKPLLEDVFEAFLGVTEKILNDRFRHRIGYPVVYKILKNIFDKMDISLRYEDLYDSKTRLKELFDLHGRELGPLVYKERKEDLITYSTVFRKSGCQYAENPDGSINIKRVIPNTGTFIKIGEGSAALKADAQQNAASAALKKLNSQGWVKPIPAFYQKILSGVRTEHKIRITPEHIIARWGGNINGLYLTKGKKKYQTKYVSTVLALYCRRRNLSGVITALEMKADPNIVDTDGLTPLDLLFIGKIQPKIVKKIMKKLIEFGSNGIIQQGIFKAYYTKYNKSYFIERIPRLSIVS